MGNIYVPDDLEETVKNEAEDKGKYPYEVVEDAVNGPSGLTPEQRKEVRDVAEDVVDSYANGHR